MEGSGQRHSPGFRTRSVTFVIFINDMPDVVKFNICKLFADDCKLYGTVNTAAGNKLQIDLRKLEECSRKWQLPFNATKCKVTHFGYHNPQQTYHLNNHAIKSSHKEKDLGVIIENTLKFHDHTAKAVKKGNQVLGVLKKTYNTRDNMTICTLYKAMVRHHLEYGNAIWAPFYQKDILKVESIQRRATKLISELRDKTCEVRLKELELSSLVYRRRRGDMIMMFKVMYGLVRMNSSILFTSAILGRTRGHNKKVYKSHAVKTARSNSFSQRVVNNWNALPNYVVNAHLHSIPSKND